MRDIICIKEEVQKIHLYMCIYIYIYVYVYILYDSYRACRVPVVLQRLNIKAQSAELVGSPP